MSTTDEIMALAQEYASAWSLVGSRFDNGHGMECADEAKAAMLKAVESLAADAERYRWLTTIGGGIGMRLAEVEREWNGCDGVEGFNAALARCAARRTP